MPDTDNQPTPGPWAVHPHATVQHSWYVAAASTAEPHAPHGRIVASHLSAADARLIAAAPVLPAVLAALREGYLYALRSPINAHRIQNQEALCQMRDALAVAEGRTEEETQALYEELALEGQPRI